MIKLKLTFAFCAFAVMLCAPSVIFAQETAQKMDIGASTPKVFNPLDNPVMAVSIPGFKGFSNPSCDQNGVCSIPWLAEYIQGLYKYGISIIGILAVITIMIAGVIWLTAAGNEERIGNAKKLIGGAMFGVLLAISSYMILNLVNPALTQLSPIKISSIEREDLPGPEEYKIFEENNGLLPGLVPEARLLTAGGQVNGKKKIITIDVETSTGIQKVQVDESMAEMTKNAIREASLVGGFKIHDIGGYSERPGCHGVGLALDINIKSNYCIDCYGKKNARVPEPTQEQIKNGREADASWYRPSGPGDGVDYTRDFLSFPSQIVDVFKKYGFCWGGDWRQNKDYMHFSAPWCKENSECGMMAPYDFSKSVRENHANTIRKTKYIKTASPITYP